MPGLAAAWRYLPNLVKLRFLITFFNLVGTYLHRMPREGEFLYFMDAWTEWGDLFLKDLVLVPTLSDVGNLCLGTWEPTVKVELFPNGASRRSYTDKSGHLAVDWEEFRLTLLRLRDRRCR